MSRKQRRSIKKQIQLLEDKFDLTRNIGFITIGVEKILFLLWLYSRYKVLLVLYFLAVALILFLAFRLRNTSKKAKLLKACL